MQAQAEVTEMRQQLQDVNARAESQVAALMQQVQEIQASAQVQIVQARQRAMDSQRRAEAAEAVSRDARADVERELASLRADLAAQKEALFTAREHASEAERAKASMEAAFKAVITDAAKSPR